MTFASPTVGFFLVYFVPVGCMTKTDATICEAKLEPDHFFRLVSITFVSACPVTLSRGPDIHHHSLGLSMGRNSRKSLSVNFGASLKSQAKNDQRHKPNSISLWE